MKSFLCDLTSRSASGVVEWVSEVKFIKNVPSDILFKCYSFFSGLRPGPLVKSWQTDNLKEYSWYQKPHTASNMVMDNKEQLWTYHKKYSYMNNRLEINKMRRHRFKKGNNLCLSFLKIRVAESRTDDRITQRID